MRYDQFMHLGWKGLIPASLAWILLVSGLRAVGNEGIDRRTMFVWIGGVALVAFLLSLVPRRDREEPAAGESPPAEPWFPVPPLPGQEVAPTLVPATVGTTDLGDTAPEPSRGPADAPTDTSTRET
jgi:NADH-quinone oxidoreductase subunit H